MYLTNLKDLIVSRTKKEQTTPKKKTTEQIFVVPKKTKVKK